jgi:hypothetical protein
MAMTTTNYTPAPDPPITYEFRVAGHLDDRWSEWFAGRTLVRNDDASTTLTIEVADQAQLHGVLAGIRDLGVTLLSLRQLDAAADASRQPNQPPHVPVPSSQTVPPAPPPGESGENAPVGRIRDVQASRIA